MDLNTEYIWLGIALIIAEVTMGNFILFFLGLAAAITGLALWLGMPAGNGIPFLVFAGLALVLLVGVRSRLKLHLVGTLSRAVLMKILLVRMSPSSAALIQQARVEVG